MRKVKSIQIGNEVQKSKMLADGMIPYLKDPHPNSNFHKDHNRKPERFKAIERNTSRYKQELSIKDSINKEHRK